MNPREIINRVSSLFKEGWRKIKNRLRLWYRKGEAAFSEGQLSIDPIPGQPEPRYRWELGATEEHCRDCAYLDGQEKTLSEWNALGIRPQSPDLECGGWNCDCRLVLVETGE